MKKFKLPILYKYTEKGQIQQWEIIINGGEFHTIEGIKGGKLTTSLPTKCSPKNVGRANETSANDQAIKEAQAKWQKKVDKGYNEVLSAEKKYFEPMLAHTYESGKSINWEEVKEGNLKVFVQPKLDGLRCISKDNTLMSRNGKPYVSCPHLYQNTEVILDGELYSHEYKEDFNKIVSLCKKSKPTDEDLKESADKVQHWVYDFPSHEGTFMERYKELEKWNKKHGKGLKIEIVPTFMIKSEKELHAYHKNFLKQGFEGTIIRIDDKQYENKRSKSLLKFKDFIDEEFKIIGYEEGTGGRTGTIGKFILQHDKNPDQTFESNVKGDFEYLREVWKDRETYIGKTATVKYFNRTPKKPDGTGNVPRFPYIIKIGREEYE